MSGARRTHPRCSLEEKGPRERGASPREAIRNAGRVTHVHVREFSKSDQYPQPDRRRSTERRLKKSRSRRSAIAGRESLRLAHVLPPIGPPEDFRRAFGGARPTELRNASSGTQDPKVRE
ncbi:hypothetical protein KM043_008852 [Ampulex compressa]|nr:hypothetical protein KM043_008852 [Ampulex compressa]